MDNMRRAICFETPDYIPMKFVINASCWEAYPQDAIFELMESHPLLFPGFRRPAGRYVPEYPLVARKGADFTDDFGCVWRTTVDGITGTVVRHPLEDWEAFASYRGPDPAVCMGIGPVDWEAERARVEAEKAAGGLSAGALRHGHTFLQLCDLRGYENLMYDFQDEDPRIFQLIELVEAFNMEIVRRYLDMGVDRMGYAEDLGMQVGPMLSPAHFRTYIKPVYQRLMRPARERGVIVHMHSDGDIRLLADDLIEGGVQVINLQDLVNGIDWIAARFAGRICVDLDIDRQLVTAKGTPEQIDALIREEVSKSGGKRGGLMMTYGWYPGVPLENARAVMDAMETYALFYS